jgi:hypothetical protein
MGLGRAQSIELRQCLVYVDWLARDRLVNSALDAPIAQWIGRHPPKVEAARSNRAGCAILLRLIAPTSPSVLLLRPCHPSRRCASRRNSLPAADDLDRSGTARGGAFVHAIRRHTLSETSQWQAPSLSCCCCATPPLMCVISPSAGMGKRTRAEMPLALSRWQPERSVCNSLRACTPQPQTTYSRVNPEVGDDHIDPRPRRPGGFAIRFASGALAMERLPRSKLAP